MNKVQPETAFSDIGEKVVIDFLRIFPLVPDWFSVQVRIKGMSLSFNERFKEENTEKYCAECKSLNVIPFSRSGFGYNNGFLARGIMDELRYRTHSPQERTTTNSAILTGGRSEFFDIILHDKDSSEMKDGFEAFRQKGGLLDTLSAHGYGLYFTDLWIGKETREYYYWREHEDWSPFVFYENELKLRVPAPRVPAEDKETFLGWKAQAEYELNKIKFGVGLDYC